MAHAWKACWVQALGGSNPPSSATGPRDLLRFRGFCCLQPRLISSRRESCPPRWAGPLCVPVGGGPPASRRSACCCLWCRWCSGRRRARPPARSPHASFARSGRSRSPPVPSGPSGALHTGGTCIAWTSPARPRRRPPAPRPGHAALAAKPRGFCGRRQSGGPALLNPGLVPLRLRGPRRSLRRGVRPGPRPSQRASIGAGPSRCSSIRPSMPSR